MVDRFVTVPDSLELPAAVKVPIARLSDAGTAGRAVLDHIADPIRHAAIAGFVPPTFSALASVATVPIATLADGVLYGAEGFLLRSSSNAGGSWTTIRDLGATGGAIITILDTSGGEVLIVRQEALYRTTGWTSNPATATVTKVLDRTGTSSFYQWGVDTNPLTGLCVAATYTGTQPYASRYFWKSTDGGATWSVIYDINDHVAETGGTLSDCHTHLAKIDPWAGDRIWISWHRAGVALQGSVLYSDDAGATFTKLTTAQPTAAVAVRGGMVFSTDESPNGVYVVTRTDNPLDMAYRLAWRWDADTLNVAGFGQWATRDQAGDRAYVAFIGDIGFNPVLVQSDGVSASLMLEAATAISTALGDGWRSIHLAGDTLVAVDRRGAAYSTTTARRTSARAGAIPPDADLGRVMAGTAGTQRATAVGRSTASAARSTALGDFAAATSTNTVSVGAGTTSAGDASTAVGALASSPGANSTALGSSASALGANGTAVGRAAVTSASGGGTAVGDSASVGAGNGTAVGTGANVLANSVAVGQGAIADASCVTIGQGADSTADLSTVVGHAAKGGGAYSTVFGETAQVAGTTQFGTALGRAATVASGHVRSVALGSTTTTTAADQVQIGGRHVELTELAADPAAPAADGARLFTRDNGAGKTQLCVRFATGAVVVIATEP